MPMNASNATQTKNSFWSIISANVFQGFSRKMTNVRAAKLSLGVWNAFLQRTVLIAFSHSNLYQGNAAVIKATSSMAMSVQNVTRVALNVLLLINVHNAIKDMYWIMANAIPKAQRSW